MTVEDLSEQIAVDEEHTAATLANIADLLGLVSSREPIVHEATAMAAYVRDAYQGLKNVLMRLAKFHGMALPTGLDWHIQLFESFCAPPRAGVPLLFPPPFANQIAKYRGFRHRFHKGYTLLLEWQKMQPLVREAESVFGEFYRRTAEHIKSLQNA